MSPRAAKFSAFLSVLCACAGLLWAQSAVSRLGMDEASARREVAAALLNGYWVGGGARAFVALAPAARAMAVNDFAAWAKAYVNSPAFKKEWADQREHSKPQPRSVKGSADDQLTQQNAAMQKQIEDMKKVAATMPPEQRKAMETAIQQMSANVQASIKDSNQQALQRQAIEGGRANDQKRYQDDLKKWEQDFPADPSALIARRLHDFINLSASVNFDAKLVDRGGRKYFADPQYESKSDNWKRCYRAGREANAAARAAATSWLQQLGK